MGDKKLRLVKLNVLSLKHAESEGQLMHNHKNGNSNPGLMEERRSSTEVLSPLDCSCIALIEKAARSSLAGEIEEFDGAAG